MPPLPCRPPPATAGRRPHLHPQLCRPLCRLAAPDQISSLRPPPLRHCLPPSARPARGMLPPPGICCPPPAAWPLRHPGRVALQGRPQVARSRHAVLCATQAARPEAAVAARLLPQRRRETPRSFLSSLSHGQWYSTSPVLVPSRHVAVVASGSSAYSDCPPIVVLGLWCSGT